ncbi:MAG: sigma-70 family RNA polymerase sigma factor [Candidatus Aminicenantes bacterium]|nr:sigma-70 family RNA polymerase sigma factor [Candidatus Aminicenantes bacterium]
MDDKELIMLVQQDDQRAFEEIMRKYKNKIINFLYNLTGDYEKAVEISQETFLRVYFKAHKYKPIAPLSSWIFTIASNLAKTELKKMNKQRYIPLENVFNRHQQGLSETQDMEKKEMTKIIKKALSTLHRRYRIPLVLKDMEGFSQEEIADILKKPVGTIKAQISRGRKYLKQELTKANLNIDLKTEGQELGNERA